MIILDAKTRSEVIAEAKTYNKNDFSLFLAEYGWQDWMNRYTEAADGEVATEEECNEIDRVLEECFDEAHEDDQLTDIEIMIMDGCTEHDAKRHLQDGAIVYPDFEENLEMYLDSYMDDDLIAEVRKMVSSKKQIPGWGIVEANGKTYYIDYAC